MIYITGDTHRNFERFQRKQRDKLPYELTENDYVIICGDFGLLWAKDKEFEFDLKWLASLPFTILWVQGNHENYNMIEEYELELWNGGKARHIFRDKIILLERGQVFQIEGKSFFTFGGASSHDVQGGILDMDDPEFSEKRKKANKSSLPYRVKNISWWEQELPTEEELAEGLKNLETVNYKVDYVITHCCATNMQIRLERYFGYAYGSGLYEADILTDYFEQLEAKLDYQRWFCGHYHVNLELDDKHIFIYKQIVPLELCY